MTSTQDLLRQRFIEACSQRDTIAASVAPLRQQRDSILAAAQAQSATADPITAQIKEMERPLFDLHNEIASISVALAGKTGTDAT